VPELAEFDRIETLPPPALALFGQDFFSSLAWYRSAQEAALAPGETPAFLVVSQAGAAQAVFPMRRRGAALSAFTIPYTGLWQPLLAPGLTQAHLTAIGRALAESWQSAPPVRLDALDGSAPDLAPLLAGFRQAGLRALRFDHFGNWHTQARGGWAAYLADRPGALRHTIRRRSKRLMQQMGADFTLLRGSNGIEAAIAAYESIYAASWKQPEPYPRFIPALMRACAAGSTLRLGVLSLGGAPAAAQFWVVRGGWAGVLKLAHDEARKDLSAGTVLTALMIEHLLDHQGVTELDFGRGDDAYKRAWTGERRARSGLLLANVRRPAGLLAILRHRAGRLLQAARKSGTPR
jgi:CelD/BcsL family acetyltransferase involved in cellulose biosynthesis